MQIENLKGARLSPQQFRLWHWAQDKPWYRVQCAIEIMGEFEPGVFQQALQHVVDRHAILRTTFISVPGIELPMQAIGKERKISCSLINLEQLSAVAQQASQEEHWHELLHRPFDLEHGPLLYVDVVRLSPQSHRVMFSLHVLCADAATLKHLSAAVLQAYAACLQNRGEIEEDDDPLQYVNVTAWLNELLQDEEAEEQFAHWRKLDLSHLSSTPLPFQRSEKTSHQEWNSSAQALCRPQRMAIPLPMELHHQLQIVSQRFEASLEVILLASWQTLLWRLTGDQDLYVGLLCDGRLYEELIDLIGPYARMVPITISLTDQRSFSWVIQQTQQSYQQALEKQLYFTGEGVSASKSEQLSFPISFAYESWPEPTTYGPLTVSWQRQECWPEPFQLQLCAQQSEEALQLQLAYNASVFSERQIQRLAGLLLHFLKSATEQPEMSIGSLALLTPQEQAVQQECWSGQQRDWPFVPLHQRFQIQAQRQPLAQALRFGDVLLSYQEVEQVANQLAHLLLTQGIRPGQRVALYLRRDQWAIISLLAVLKAGGCYVPLDEDLPPSRVQLLLHQLEPAALICSQELQKHLEYLDDDPFPVIQIESLPVLLDGQPTDAPQVPVHPQQDAYVIYTSGSTGTPKGVRISQQSISNYTQALCELLEMQAGWHVATVSSLAADLGNTAIFCALASGGCLHVLPYDLVTDGAAFASYVQRHPLDVLKIVPTHLQALLAAGATGIIPRQRLILGGEALPWTLVEQLQRSQDAPLTCQLYNHYGPTETTIGALVNPLGPLQQIRVPAPRERAYSVPIGRPIANLRVAVWDDEHRTVPQGIKGELYIAGAGVAPGYLGDPTLTTERFLTIQQTRWYRTGDIVCENEEGQIEFIGRQDDQAKLRGYRIEMGEIEEHLRSLPMIREAVVQLRTDGPDGQAGDPYLVGYIIPWKHPGPDQQAVREALAQQLPSYLIPRRVVCLEQFPLSPNGKLDRRRLPAPPQENVEQARVGLTEEARTPIEAVMQQIWRQVLDVHEVGRGDDFFRLGGHSLLGTRMIAQVRTAFGIEVPITWLFETPTVAGLSQRIEEELRQGHGLALPPLVPNARDQALPLSFAQQRLWFLDQLEPGSTAYTIPRVIRLQGLLDCPALQQALHTVILRHENLRTTFPSRQGEPWQQISPQPLTHLVVVDLHQLSPTAREEQARQLIRQEVARPFDLEHGPLLRTWLLQLAEEEHILLLTLHHIISDGWSSGRLVQEMTTLYMALQRGVAAELPALPIQYADYALWQRSWLQGEVLERQLDYWKTRLAGLSPLNLPTDHPRPPVLRFRGAWQRVQLPLELSQQLNALSQREGVTLFMTLLAAFQVLLARYSGQQDIAVGTPIANRTREEVEGLIGFFVNMLVLRSDLSDNPPFLELLKQVRATALGAYTHQDVPFEQVVDAVPSQREHNRSPLFQVVFALQNAPAATMSAEQPTMQAKEEESDLSMSTAKFELTMIMQESDQGLHTTVEYTTDLFTDAFIARFLSHWQQLLAAIVANPERHILALPLLTTAESKPVQLDWHILPPAHAARYEEALAHPLAHTFLVVLDEALQPVPADVVGQLYIGNLADLELAHETAPQQIHERLVSDPWGEQPGARLYRTGDRVRYRSSGALEYLDSLEHPRQVILDGSLLSLDELEAVALSQMTAQSCRILARKNPSGAQELVAYVVPTAQGSPEVWQEQLRASLPEAWLPKSYIPVSHLPLTDTGEIDDQALLAMAPLTTQILAQWEQYLRKQEGVEQVAVVIQEHARAQLPLHLDDLLPGWKEHTLLHQPEKLSGATGQQEHPAVAQSSRLSISEGEALHLRQGVRTLPQALLHAARQNGDARLIYILPDGSELTWTYQQLLIEAQRVLAGLRQLGVRPQERIIMQVEWCQEFLPVLWACLLGGIVPVPASIAPTYEQPTSASSRLYHAWQMLDRPIVVAGSNLAPSLQALANSQGWENFRVVSFNSLQASNAPDVTTYYESQPDDLALILLTSGSSGTPKGVMQRHISLLSMAAGVVQSQNFSDHEVTLNWMPLDHVGGVVMFHLRDVYLGCSQIHVPTQSILQDPLKWLDLIDRYRVTITWAPNFAFGLVNDQAQEIKRRHWDLSSLHFILNGGEAIVAKTARRFLELLQPYRLSARAMHPAWGMSETSSGIVFSDRFALASTSDEDLFVEVGAPIPGISIRIVDAQDYLTREGVGGHVQVKGATITAGYYPEHHVNQEAFHADGWFDTGDLGVMQDGRVTITGRAKDVIIINGVNYYGQEIEAAVEELEEVETSYTAACGVRDGESVTDQLAIFIVSRVQESQLLDMLRKVRARVSAQVGITPTFVLPVAKEAIPKTAIGKIQRAQLKQEFEAGKYKELLKELDRRMENANTIPDWFYRKCWQRSTLRQRSLQTTKGVVLVLADDTGMGQVLCEQLRQQQRCIHVERGTNFARLGEDHYRIQPDQEADYNLLGAALAVESLTVTHVVHLWGYHPNRTEDAQGEHLKAAYDSVLSIFHLIQTLERGWSQQERREGEQIQFVVVSAQVEVVQNSEELAYEQAPVVGLLKTFARELPWLHCVHIDVAADDQARNALHVLQELYQNQEDQEVAYREGQRFVARLEHIDWSMQPMQPSPLVQQGFYLLSGGLGGLGYELACHLLQEYQAHLLLLGRTPISLEEGSLRLPGSETQASRLAHLQALAQHGGAVRYVAVDVCDLKGLQQALDQLQHEWQRPLNGIFHLAGEFHEQLLQAEMVQQIEQTLRPKVEGTWTLHQLLKGRPGALFVSYSSVNAFFGGRAVGAYAAANCFQEIFAQYQRIQCGLQSYCISWSMWEEVGMSLGYQFKELSRAQGYCTIALHHGWYSLLTVLRHKLATVLVGLDGNNQHIRPMLVGRSYALHEAVAYVAPGLPQGPQQGWPVWWGTQPDNYRLVIQAALPMTETGDVDIERLGVQSHVSGFAAKQKPRTEIEQQVLEIWCQVMKNPQIGVFDNFFELGGHSLLATQVIAHMQHFFQINLPVRNIFEHPTVADLAQMLEREYLRSSTPPPLVAVTRDQYLPLSFAQQRLWFLDQLEPESITYLISSAVRMQGPLDRPALQRTLASIIQRHENLRTTFPSRQGEPWQQISPHPLTYLVVVDLRQLSPAVREEQARQLAQQERTHPFDLAQGPLLRSCALQMAEHEHILLLTMHHIISDGWSMNILVRELTSLYTAFSQGQTPSLSPLPVQYADYALWQRSWLQGEVLQQQLDYWKQQLAGLSPLELPTDHPRPAIRRFRGALLHRQLPAELSRKLHILSQQEGVTLFMTMLAAFQVLLARSSGQEDIAVGSPIANRTRQEVEGLIGFFANTLVLRADLSGNPTFLEVLARVRRVCLDAYTHQEVPFEQVVDALHPQRDLSRSPLFQVLFHLQHATDSDSDEELAQLKLERFAQESVTAKFDLTLSLFDNGQQLSSSIEYNCDLFEPATIQRWLARWQVLLESLVHDPQQRISQYSLLPPQERQTVLEWNERSPTVVSPLCLHERFTQQARLHPETIAAVFEEGHLTYGALDAYSTTLAGILRGAGVRADMAVGLCAERNLELLVGLLGILKAGGAYVPLDPYYPQHRLALMLKEAAMPLLVVQASLSERFASTSKPLPMVLIEQAWSASALVSSPASAWVAHEEQVMYLLFTSGSTGIPKGVAMSHKAISNLIDWQAQHLALSQPARTIQMASWSFDNSVNETFSTWCYGGSLYLVREEVKKDAAALVRFLEQMAIERVFPPYSAMLSMAEAVAFTGIVPRSLGVILSSAEPLQVNRKIREWFEQMPDCRLLNEYGPSESHVITVHQLPEEPPQNWPALPPIGRVIGNSEAYVLDDALQMVPTGVIGELYVGGVALARGYWQRAELTAERFIPHPWSRTAGARLYRTGDRVRAEADGTLHFLGRRDEQVKVRGYRIELLEIEAIIGMHPAVSTVAVGVQEREQEGFVDKRLIAYVVNKPGQRLSLRELHSFVGERLPQYMLPAALVELEQLPLSPSGKVNRRQLTTLAVLDEPERQEDEQEPRNELEELVAQTWKLILQREQLGREDNFFEMGGHSLLATQVVSRLRRLVGVELPVRAIFEAPTVAQLAGRLTQELQRGQGLDVPEIVPVSRNQPLPLSFAQQRLWFLNQLEPDSTLYNMPGTFRLQGPLSVDALRRSWQEIIQRHEVLRTTFDLYESEAVQQIMPHWREEEIFSLIDLSQWPEKEQEQEVQRWIKQEAQRVIDLTKGPLVRMRVLKLGEESYIVLTMMHHIVSDGWSMSIFQSELTMLYHAFAQGEPSPLAPLSLQYADFAIWQRNWLQGEVLEKELAYWRQQLAGIPEVIELPLDHSRPAVQTFRGTRYFFLLPQTLLEGLKALSQQEGVTLFMTLLAAFATLLSRYSGQDDIVIGTPVANRPYADLEDLIGFFVNTLVLRADLSSNPDIKTFLGRIRQMALDAYAHQDLPFEKLVEALAPERVLSHSPLFQVTFALQQTAKPSQELRELKLQQLGIEGQTAKFDLTLSMQDTKQGLVGIFEYSTDLFEATTIERMATHLQQLLESMVADPSRRLQELSMLTEDERQLLLVEWNRTARPYPATSSLPELFEAQVARTPDAIALVCQEQHLSYAALNRYANQLGRLLLQAGVEPDQPVAFCLQRSPLQLIAVLAILKAGGAYLPLDLSYPPQRLELMLTDAHVDCLLTEEAARPTLQDIQVAHLLSLDHLWSQISQQPGDDLALPLSSQQRAYVIYTSGSTGIPKGVVIPHQAVNRLVCETDYLQILPTDRVAQASNVSFDAATFEVWGALLNGACLISISKDVLLSPQALATCLDEQQIGVLFMTTALFNQMVQEAQEGFGGLRCLLFGGEAVDPRSVRMLLERGHPQRLLHVYGPTENTTYSTWYAVEQVAGQATTIPIGKPIANSEMYVLDDEMEPVPVGALGELYVGGAGLAHGYLRRPELTAERFVPHPFSAEPGSRLYKTGDVVKALSDGNVDFVGRKDQQVKLHGFRIEPGEIAVVLQQHAAVRQALVMLREDRLGDKRLVAYIVPHPHQLVIARELRAFLGQHLPDHMVPAFYIPLDELPLTPNGKVDRRMLPMPENRQQGADKEFVAARDPLETQLIQMWEELLNVRPIGVHDNFFELGGHSLLAAQIVARLQQMFQINVPVRSLFEHPTIADLAQLIEDQHQQFSTASALVPVSREQLLPLSFAQQRLWFLDQLEPENAAYNIPVTVEFEGWLDLKAFGDSLTTIIERHEGLRTIFQELEDQPYQVIVQPGRANLVIIDLQSLAIDQRERVARKLSEQEARLPFDLRKGPLLRSWLLRLAEQRHWVRLNMHHIISDGWSMNILVQELTSLYTAFTQGTAADLSPLPIQYADYAFWQRSWLQGEVLEQQLDYWKQQLSGSVPLALPTDYPRPAIQTSRGERQRLRLPVGLSQQVHALSQREGTTLFMTLLAAFTLLLHYSSGQDDLVVGTNVANRTRAETEGVIGFFVNQLVLRTNLSGNPCVREVLGRVKDVALGAYAHQDLPFDRLLMELNPQRDLSHTPLFQAKFALEHAQAQPGVLPAIQVEPVKLEQGVTKFDLFLTMVESDGDLTGSLDYRTDLFREETMTRLLHLFAAIVEQMVSFPERRLSEIDAVITEIDIEEQNKYERDLQQRNIQKLGQSRRKKLHQVEPQ